MNLDEATKQLCAVLKDTPEYREYEQAKAVIKDDAGIMSLVNEYKKLQLKVQFAMISGQKAEDDENRRFQSLSTLLFSDIRTSTYLLSEMHMEQVMNNVLMEINAAAGLHPELTGEG